MTRLEQTYKDTIVPALTEKFGYKSAMEVPRLQKITLNMGLGEAVGDKKIVEKATGDLATITGQKPVVCLCLLYTSPSPRDRQKSRMPSSA